MADPVGKARIEIEADISGLQEGLSDAKARVESFGSSAEEATGRASAGASGAVSSFKRMSGNITSAVGAVTGLIGAASLAVGGLIRLENRINSAGERAKELGEKVKDLGKEVEFAFRAPTESEKIEQTYEKLRDQIQKTLDEVRKDPFQGSLEYALEQDLERLTKNRDEALRSLRAESLRNAQKERSELEFEIQQGQRDQLKAFQDAIAQIADATLSDADRIKRQYEQTARDLSEAISKSLLPQDQVDQLIQRLKEASDAALQIELENIDKVEQAERQKNARVASDWEDQMGRALDAFSAKLSSRFSISGGGDFGQSLINSIDQASARIAEAAKHGGVD